jgi:uncharacterized protein (DUF1015 family)
MAHIEPFRAVVYDTRKVGDISDVLSPPYDVIGPQEQDALYRRHPRNAVRLDYGKDEPGDSVQNNHYTRSFGFLKEWLRDGTLRKEDTPAIYLYDQCYTLRGESRTRRAFVSLVRLEPYGQGRIYPHELTHSGPKQDRLNLLKATRTLFSQVFALYEDQSGQIASILEHGLRLQAMFEFSEPQGGLSRVWRISDRETVERLQATMKTRALYIADGHHRYETCLNYGDFLRESGVSVPGAEFTAMACVSMSDPGLAILPTHRCVRLPEHTPLTVFRERLSRLFDRRPTPCLDALLEALDQATGRQVLGMFEPSTGFSVLELTSSTPLPPAAYTACSQDWHNLDVSVLHCRLLKECAGLPEDELFDTPAVRYSHSPEECVQRVTQGDCHAAFFVRPVTLSDMERIVSQREKMPPKSTFFYPKLMSGLFIYDMTLG